MITAIPLVAATAKLTTPQARAASASVDMRPGNADDGHPGVFPRALSITALTASAATCATSSGRSCSSVRSTWRASFTAVCATARAASASRASNWPSKASSKAPIWAVACWAKLCLKLSNATRPSR